MSDITTIPTSDLRRDLADSKEDALWCRSAINCGILTYGVGVPESMQTRLDANERIIAIIEAKLERRRLACLP